MDSDQSSVALAERADVEHEQITFRGRAEELAALDVLAQRRPTLVVLSGPAGVGKTALALNWARTRDSRFPTGVTYVDLDGAEPVETRRLVLRQLDLADDRIPEDTQELYRVTLTGYRLIILDNVPAAAHVREAIPADPDVMVLAISRYALPALALHDQAHQLRVEPLPMDDAVELLPGADRAVSETVANLCGRMPLALRIMAGAGEVQLESVPALEIGDGEAGIRAALSIAYRQLEPEVARVFRILGSLPVASFSIDCAASVCALDRPEAEQALAALARRCLLVGDRMPESVRWYALERAEAEEPRAELDAGLRRAADWYREKAGSNQADLAAMIGALSRKGWHRLAAELAAALFEFYHQRRLWRDWVAAYSCAWTSARIDGDWRTRVRILVGLGVAHGQLGRLDESADAYRRALDIATGVGDELIIGPIMTDLELVLGRRHAAAGAGNGWA